MLLPRSFTLLFILLTLSVVCSTRLRITPMRSSKDVFICAMASCRACTCVWIWMSCSFVPAEAGRAERSNTANRGRTNQLIVFIYVSLDAEWLLLQRKELDAADGEKPLATVIYQRPVRTKWPRRFCCQQDSFDSVQKGCSLP